MGIIGKFIAVILLLAAAAVLPAQHLHRRMLIAPKPSAVATSSLYSNLIAYWRLDETSGSRNDAYSTNHLTAYNTPGYGPGVVTNAALFERASSEYTEIPDNDALSIENTSWTYVCWLKVTNLVYFGTNNLYFSGKMQVSGQYEWSGYIDTTKKITLMYSTNGTTTSFFAQAPAAITSNVWYMAVIIVDAVNKKAIVGYNNTSWGTNTTVIKTPSGTDPFTIGRSRWTSHYFDGYIDEAAFWKRVLTQAEINELYNSGAGKPFPW